MKKTVRRTVAGQASRRGDDAGRAGAGPGGRAGEPRPGRPAGQGPSGAQGLSRSSEACQRGAEAKAEASAGRYVLARVHLLVGEAEEALAVLEGVPRPENPDENVVNLLAALKLRDKQYDEAAKLYKLAAAQGPANTKWTKSLARVYLESGDERGLAGSLEQLAEMDADELAFRKKLAQMALDDKDYKRPRAGRERLQIDVRGRNAHLTWPWL